MVCIIVYVRIVKCLKAKDGRYERASSPDETFDRTNGGGRKAGHGVGGHEDADENETGEFNKNRESKDGDECAPGRELDWIECEETEKNDRVDEDGWDEENGDLEDES